jgi:hypothetical protein
MKNSRSTTRRAVLSALVDRAIAGEPTIITRPCGSLRRWAGKRRGGFVEQDEEKCAGVFRPHPAQILESITFMILDRFDPKSS